MAEYLERFTHMTHQVWGITKSGSLIPDPRGYTDRDAHAVCDRRNQRQGRAAYVVVRVTTTHVALWPDTPGRGMNPTDPPQR